MRQRHGRRAMRRAHRYNGVLETRDGPLPTSSARAHPDHGPDLMAQLPALPENESGRIAALQACRALDTPPEPALEDLTRLSAHVCGAPLAAISLVDDE